MVLMRCTLKTCRTSTPIARPFHRSLTITSAHRSKDDKADFLSTFFATHEPAQSSIDHFSSVPWTSRILQDETYQPLPFYSRHPFPPSTENALFSSIVSTPSTIPHLLALRHRSLRTPPPLTSGSITTKPAPILPEILLLASLGPSLSAHPDIVHGGFQAVLFDEIMRFLILCHFDNVVQAEGEERRKRPRERHFTLRMEMEYLAPVAVGRDVLLRARLERRVGRKWVASADLVGDEGRVLTRAESLWVTAKPRGDGESDGVT
ncbi:hypothetical protein CAC42_7826 [Sphaceloma murrayae]|uniref:Thioesterase domain-containing protein n=1 Tax=Sphaceloma murrayae TaxID=2082308 RepID=A0A2K1QXX2_9PEZI|nr:hypothetical protein CAC42_7826 [Sphaceloma murrayae]